MKKILSLCFLCIAYSLSAQNKATKILEQCAQTIKKSYAIETSFSISENFLNNKSDYTIEGMLINKGNKFVLDTPDSKTWFDGKTQWSLLKNNEEVNISSPTAQELTMLNPISLSELYQRGNKTICKGEKKMNGTTMQEIQIVSSNKQSVWSSLNLLINKTTLLPASITFKQRDGKTSTIHFAKMKTRVNLPDSFFVFNQKAYPNVEIIDLR